MTYREREYESLLYGVKSARSLAHRSRVMAEMFPAYRREEMDECHRHFARARDYLQLAKAEKSRCK